MGEETNKPTVEQPTNPKKIEVTRNDVAVVFVEGRTTKGQQAGKVVFTPEFATAEDFVKWIGLDNIYGKGKRWLRALSIEWAEESQDKDTGEFKDVMFKQLAASFDATGETMSDLREEEEALKDELISYNTEDPAQVAAFMACARKIQTISVAIAKKSRVRKEKTEAVAQPA